MKNLKKLTALLLALLLMLSLTGCGGFEARVAKAALKMQKLHSLRMDVNADISMNMSMFGETVKMDMTMSGPFDLNFSPLKGKGQLTMDTMGEVKTVLFYYEKVDSKFITYTSADDGKTWTKSETDASQIPDSGFNKDSLSQLAKLAAGFQETGTETVRGAEAVMYSGTVSWADLSLQVKTEDILNSISQSMQIDLDPDDLDFSKLGNIPLTVGFAKKGGMIVRYSMDLTETMQSMVPMIMKLATKSVMAQSGLGAMGDLDGFDLSMLGFELNVDRLFIMADLYDFDAVGEIQIPDAARSAKLAA